MPSGHTAFFLSHSPGAGLRTQVWSIMVAEPGGMRWPCSLGPQNKVDTDKRIKQIARACQTRDLCTAGVRGSDPAQEPRLPAWWS